MDLKEMCDFLTLKLLPLADWSENAHFTREFRVLNGLGRDNFPLKKVNFLAIGQKDGDFVLCVFVIFLGLKKLHICFIKVHF